MLFRSGDPEKLKIAVLYGADAVYFGGETFSLRAGAGNFTVDEIEEGVAFAHEYGCKCYMMLNIYAHNEDIEPLEKYLQKIKHIPIDAFLISDPGVLTIVKKGFAVRRTASFHSSQHDQLHEREVLVRHGDQTACGRP